MIYFDNSSTSPIDSEVLDAMMPYLKEEYGNPSSKYYCKAINAKNAVEDARAKVAMLLGAKQEEIIFTSGSTESTNFIIKGYLDYRKYYCDGKNHVITSMVEHKATLNTCKFLNGNLYSNNDPTISLFGDKKKVNRGYEASFIGVNSEGEIEIQTVIDAIKENTALASFIYINNEVGSISDIKSIAEICHEKGIAIHSDLTQAIGKIPINVDDQSIDFASCSAHKLYGPKGVGAAFLKADDYGIAPITAFIHGGEQEFGYRAGTLAVHNIVGFGKAAEIALRDINKNEKKIADLDNYALGKILDISGIRLTNPSVNRMKGLISIIVDKHDFNNEIFVKKVSEELAISTGSACSAGDPSYVICALELEEQVSKVLRITINKYSSKEEIDKLSDILSRELK